MPEFKCEICGSEFALPQQVVDRYPNWVPKRCKEHRADSNKSIISKKYKPAKFSVNQEVLTCEEVLETYTSGPLTGIFTDGSARPNPGPGGWALVWVKDNQIIKQLNGQEKQTTNNRMELTALINAYQLLSTDSEEQIYTDSELCVNILTKWAKNWKQRGWKKKDGEIKNLDLVQSLYNLYEAHPLVKLSWVKAHNGWRWNEYADALAASWVRE